ncbi:MULTISPECIES: hypothetical protein [Paenibacillus]|uniref:hypothetical protein n=1 Tax=Paenibacillus TaxID=44249 RepID=UPI00096F82B7|nr:hypothetical protein [Paenibacillus odorifer]OMD87543.1 hypothetical protein BSK53_00630 [Paenibacillus odorifer]
MNKYMQRNLKTDRFNSDYHLHTFPDSLDKEVIEYSICSGCGEVIYLFEVAAGEILDIYGMSVHDERTCIKKAVDATTAILEEE